jgi:hypothetical protein
MLADDHIAHDQPLLLLGGDTGGLSVDEYLVARIARHPEFISGNEGGQAEQQG